MLYLHCTNAQTITVTNDQDLKFGSFYLSGISSGSISISNNGDRSANGGVVILPSTVYQPWIFTISTDSETQMLVTVDNPSTNLSNANGDQITLTAGVSNPAVANVQQNSPAQMVIGGTISISNGVAQGFYTGDMLLTFSLYHE
ncbi:hypothetical protein LPB144_07875 [Christiangramia salexigens]|uniref:DUF4402 domain-containing protein n=2 Tax=Christiangramia salexigens TaxID=1913577 RepID=A0A1L3J5D4_9FLAO|nr:hypothetical protein LPB144_07875 [Christiangramia salexigens]